MADPIEIEMEDACYLSLFNNFSLDREFEGFDLDEFTIVANDHAVFVIILC